MDVVISSALSKSCLLHSCSSSDFALRLAKSNKFTKDLRTLATLIHTTLYPARYEPVRTKRSSFRGHTPRTCIFDDKAPIRMPPAPWTFRGPSYCGFRIGPFHMGSTSNLDCTSRTCNISSKGSWDSQGCCSFYLLYCNMRRRAVGAEK
jgi:hypothetical protein